MPASQGVRAGRSGSKWRRVVKFFKENHPWVCSLCGGDIPKDVDNQKDPMGYNLHHTPPLSVILREGLDPYAHEYLSPSHKKCNQEQGTKIDQKPAKVSRQW